jgi:hypothetical protein
MKRHKYYINNLANNALKRVRGNEVMYFSTQNDCWRVSIYTTPELDKYPFTRLSRDEARHRIPEAFRSA